MIKIGKERALMIATKLFDEIIYEISLSEGNQMTFLETASTISGIVPKNVRTKDVILVEGLKNGLDYVLEKVKEDKFYLDKNTFSMINRLVASHDNYDNLGGFRLHGIRIAGARHKETDPSKLDEDFYKTVNKYLDSENNGIREINLFLDLVKSQYFGDGNKRTSQLMACGLLVTEGYVPFAINFRDIEFSQPFVEFYDDENKREQIMTKLLKKQEEITKDFLSEDEIKELNSKKNLEIKDKKVPTNFQQIKIK